jgi:hypothetical protein
MTPAEQAKQADLSRSEHRGPPPPLLPHAWSAMSARRITPTPGCDAMVSDRRSPSIFGAADHPLDTDLCTPCSHPVADYIYR